MLYDAHNHLQDARLDAERDALLQQLPAAGLTEAVVNGSDEEDWELVAQLARTQTWVRPSFGLHPWYVKDRSPQWQTRLQHWLQLFPEAAVGEIGLDRWIENPDLPAQIDCFRWQYQLAVEQQRPMTLHCLRAWGLLDEQLCQLPPAPRGFLLHSYGGPAEMIPGMAKRGAYFSLSPYFGHARKAQQRAVFQAVPLDRLLAETDAPDMWPPAELNPHPLTANGQPLNHPANLIVSYRLLAEIRQMPLENLIEQIAQNHQRLFGPSASAHALTSAQPEL